MHCNGRQIPSRAIRAHAMKNCLAIVSAVNRLLEAAQSEAERHRLARSQNAIERLRALIDEDLVPDGDSLCRCGAAPIPASLVLSTVHERVEDIARARGVRVAFHIGVGDVGGDPSELAEALLNIVMNAVDSTPRGAVVVSSQVGEDGGQLWTVEDDGPGMPGHLLARLGTPFLSRRQGGSGLGVAVARDTVERHGGWMDILSAPGLGTIVSIHLPRASSAGVLDVNALPAASSP